MSKTKNPPQGDENNEDENTNLDVPKISDEAEDKRVAQLRALSEVAVRESVLEIVGKPPFEHTLKAAYIAFNRFRVNLINLKSGLVEHSWWVRASPEGGILSASPALRRLYQ